ncbi:RNA 2',3'-cyclic phosphodiesterase [Methylobacterium sp. M6A4_1b]
MPRLFTGLEIPPDIGRALALKRGALPGSRWIKPSDYHITLRFLGDVEVEVAEALHERLIEARSRAPFAVTLDGLASFGGERPRAILATVTPNPELLDLQAEQERLARRVGAEAERRKFTPHVTLARLRREAGAEDVAAYLGERGLFTPLIFTAERVALFSARESKGGGPYVVEAAYPLS